MRTAKRRSECEAAAGSDIIIVSDFAVCKRVLRDARRVARRRPSGLRVGLNSELD
jgi:hypothetical protein